MFTLPQINHSQTCMDLNAGFSHLRRRSVGDSIPKGLFLKTVEIHDRELFVTSLEVNLNIFDS